MTIPVAITSKILPEQLQPGTDHKLYTFSVYQVFRNTEGKRVLNFLKTVGPGESLGDNGSLSLWNGCDLYLTEETFHEVLDIT